MSLGRYFGENPDIFGKEGTFRPKTDNDFWAGEDDDMPDGRFFPVDNPTQGYDCYVDEFEAEGSYDPLDVLLDDDEDDGYLFPRGFTPDFDLDDDEVL